MCQNKKVAFFVTNILAYSIKVYAEEVCVRRKKNASWQNSLLCKVKIFVSVRREMPTWLNLARANIYTPVTDHIRTTLTYEDMEILILFYALFSITV